MKLEISRFFFRSLFTSVFWWAGAAVSVILFVLVSNMVGSIATTQFEHHVNNVHLAIQSRVQSYTDILRATKALFDANTEVTRDQFHVYVKNLDLQQNYPGIQTLNFARHIKADQKDAFRSAMRADNTYHALSLPDFQIHPEGERPEYTVLTYLEPIDVNPSALGFDMSTLPAARAALESARDTGKMISSGRIIDVTQSKKLSVIAIRTAVYRYKMPLNTVEQRRAAYYGSVGIGFDINQLMRETVGKADALEHIRVRIMDVGPGKDFREPGQVYEQSLIFDSDEILKNGVRPLVEDKAKNLLTRTISLPIASRQWQIEYQASKAAMVSGFERHLPWSVPFACLVATLLLYGIYYFLISARKRAVELANEMTKDLRRSEAHLAEAQHMASLGSWLLDPLSGTMQWSSETFRIFGREPDNGSIAYQNYLALLHEEDRQQVRDGLENSIVTGIEFDIEHRITRQDGSIRWVHTISRPIKNDRRQLVRGTTMDITERKVTVQALQRSQELLRELTAYQDRIKEEERRRIAREIHDELGQTLLALRIDISMLEARTGNAHPRLNARIREALQQLDTTVRTIRTIINDLRPAVLDLGLTAAIEWQVAEFRRRSGIGCELFIAQHDIEVNNDSATTLFRILQESLTNITRHASASHVRVALYLHGARLVLKITDNGIGMELGDRKKPNSFGLVGIEERVLALNGEFAVTSTPGKGVTLEIAIPYKGLSEAKPLENTANGR